MSAPERDERSAPALPQDRTVPDRFTEPLERYVETGRLPGDFLTAVLENDLRRAVGLATEDSLELLPALVRWLTWEAPHAAWGSRESVESWRERKHDPRGEASARHVD